MFATVGRAGKETINAMYEIDPEHNHGVGFQFDEVVRDKNKRRHMHAVDCECCREVSVLLLHPLCLVSPVDMAVS